MAFAVRTGGAWSAPIASQRVWIMLGGVWTMVSSMALQDGEAGPWQRFYDAFPMLAPTGTIGTSAGAPGVGALSVTNRYASGWRVRGVARVRDAGGTIVSSLAVDVLGSLVSRSLDSVTPGTVEFEVHYFDPATGVTGPTATLSRSYTLAS